MQASVQDIAFEVRRRSTIPAVSLEKQMYEFMSWICMRTYYRHRFKGADLQEFCDDMMDEHAKVRLFPSLPSSAKVVVIHKESVERTYGS